MKTDKLLKLIQQKKAMRSGGALPLPKAQQGIVNQNAYDLWYKYNTPEGRSGIPEVYSDYDYRRYFQDAVTGVNPLGYDEESMHFPDTYKYPWHPSFSDESIYYVNQKQTPALSYQTKRKGGLAKAQEGLQFVPNGTYGNYYDPSTGQYIPQVYLPDVNIVADKELPFQNGKFAPLLASRGMVENDALSDPIALAAALTAGGVGLGATALSQAPRVFARNLASEATMGLSDLTKAGLKGAAKQLPGSSTSNSIMRNSEGQIQFLDNEAYRDALVTGKRNIVNYLSDSRYKEVVEANQQLANRLNMNRVLPIQREMGNVGLHDARVAKIKQPITILDPRSLETKIIQGTNEGVQAQYSRNLDGSGFLNIPRVHDKATTIKNIEHEALHHVYPNLGEGYPSFTPLETTKAKSVFKPSSELRKIEETNNVPLWYLDDADELVPNSFDLANDLGIEKFQKYPGIESFKKMLDSYSGGKKFIKEALKLNNKRDYKRAWDMLSGVRLGLVPPAAIIGAGAMQQIEEQQIGGSSNMKTDKLLQLITNANPRFQKGGGLNDLVVSEMWEKLTGTKWSQAKKLGLTDGSYEKNLQLRNMLAEEAAKPKPNMGKFTGRGTPQVPKASAATRNLTAAALQQTATPRGSTAVNMPVVSAPVAPVAKKPGSRPAMTKEQMAQALDQARGINPNPAARSTSTVAQPVIQTPVGRMPMPAEKPVLVPVTPPMGQPTYSQQAEESGSMFPNLSRMATASMLNMLPVVGGVQAANTYGPMMARNAAAGLYDATIGPEINYLTDPNSALLPNFVRGTLGAVGVPLNVSNSLSYLMGTGMAMDDRSLSDEQKRSIYQAAQNAAKKGKKSFTYEDYVDSSDPSADLYTKKLKRGQIGFLDAVLESYNNPGFIGASVLGGSNFEWGPNGTLKVVNVSDWNPEDANFSNPNSPYQYYRNFLRNVNRNRIKNMTPEERAAEDKKNTISLTIPSSIMQEQKAGGAKRSLKIRIRKNG